MYKVHVTPNIATLEFHLSRSLKVTVRSDTGAGAIELAGARVPHISGSWGTGAQHKFVAAPLKIFRRFAPESYFGWVSIKPKVHYASWSETCSKPAGDLLAS